MSLSATLSSLPHLQVWAHYEEQPVEEVMPVLEEKERSASYKPVFVTEITDDLHFYVQDVETGECLCAAPSKIPHGTYSCYCPCLHRLCHLWNPQVSPGVDMYQAKQVL